jgi:hypothetical protein
MAGKELEPTGRTSVGLTTNQGEEEDMTLQEDQDEIQDEDEIEDEDWFEGEFGCFIDSKFMEYRRSHPGFVDNVRPGEVYVFPKDFVEAATQEYLTLHPERRSALINMGWVTEPEIEKLDEFIDFKALELQRAHPELDGEVFPWDFVEAAIRQYIRLHPESRSKLIELGICDPTWNPTDLN